jgi:hypothetical protein
MLAIAKINGIQGFGDGRELSRDFHMFQASSNLTSQ